MPQESRETYLVKDRATEVPGVCTLKLSSCNGNLPSYIPGQCITIYFPESGTPEGKAYSISSAPWEDTMNITVRAVGEFSNRLCAMNSGDRITGSAPLGYFYSESKKSPLVMVAGGTGIMPFRAMIMDAAKKNPARKMALFYSARAVADIIFGTVFDGIWSEQENFSMQYFVTREGNPPPPIIPGRMNAEVILNSAPTDSGREFLLCGSIPFVRDMWRDLRDKGVSGDAIYTEAFFS